MIKSNLLSKFSDIGLVHGISTIQDGVLTEKNLPADSFLAQREEFCKKLGINLKQLVLFDQSHGSGIKIVTENDLGSGVFYADTAVKSTDGGITDKKNIYLVIKTADCVPMIGFDRKTQTVFAVHAGWRGIVQGIHIKCISKLLGQFGSNPENIFVYLGPSIAMSSYGSKEKIVQENLIEWVPFIEKSNSETFVDLAGYMQKDLAEIGIPKNQIEVSPIDTYKSERFFSARRGDKARFWSVIGISS